MAEVNVIPPDEFIKSLEKLGNLDKVAPRMLENGIAPLQKQVKQGAQKHVVTGQMAASVTHSKPKKNKKGDWGCAVTFRGKDKKTGIRNAQKAFVVEYGKSNQPEQPFVRPAVIATEGEVLKNMQESFEYETQLNNIKV